ncbi:MAG: hypothetical protein J5725_12380 [Bacteroidales bacterium]|nr:hypothetical protein [Bacteroidales bacterium]
MPIRVDDSGVIHVEKDQQVIEEGHKLSAKTVVCQPCAKAEQEQANNAEES